MFYPTFVLLPALPLLILALGLRAALLPSIFKPYNPPAKNTTHAPNNVPGDNLFPNSHMLNSRLINFLTFRTMVTVSAEAAEARRLTPRIQAYCVNTFMTKYASCRGMFILSIPLCRSKGNFDRISWFGKLNAGEAANFKNCLSIPGKNGMKSGSARRCE